MFLVTCVGNSCEGGLYKYLYIFIYLLKNGVWEISQGEITFLKSVLFNEHMCLLHIIYEILFGYLQVIKLVIALEKQWIRSLYSLWGMHRCWTGVVNGFCYSVTFKSPFWLNSRSRSPPTTSYPIVKLFTIDLCIQSLIAAPEDDWQLKEWGMCSLTKCSNLLFPVFPNPQCMMSFLN